MKTTKTANDQSRGSLATSDSNGSSKQRCSTYTGTNKVSDLATMECAESIPRFILVQKVIQTA